MLTAAWVCVLARYASGHALWEDRWRIFEVVGVFTLPVTIVTGFIDTRGFSFLTHPQTDAPLIWHMTSGFVAAGAFAAHYLWRRRVPRDGVTRSVVVWDVSLVTFGMLALIASGLIAGEMVYGT